MKVPKPTQVLGARVAGVRHLATRGSPKGCSSAQWGERAGFSILSRVKSVMSYFGAAQNRADAKDKPKREFGGWAKDRAADLERKYKPKLQESKQKRDKNQH